MMYQPDKHQRAGWKAQDLGVDISQETIVRDDNDLLAKVNHEVGCQTTFTWLAINMLRCRMKIWRFEMEYQSLNWLMNVDFHLKVINTNQYLEINLYIMLFITFLVSNVMY